jgi:hypothetical protein
LKAKKKLEKVPFRLSLKKGKTFNKCCSEENNSLGNGYSADCHPKSLPHNKVRPATDKLATSVKTLI